MANPLPAAAAVLAMCLGASCAKTIMTLQPLAAPPCETAGPSIQWMGPTAPEDRRKLGAWCRTVGPAVVRSPSQPAPTDGSKQEVVVVSWNVHEGAGDITRVVSVYRPANVIVLLQEAMRRGADVPADVPAGLDVPGREGGRPQPAPDVVAVAQSLNLWLAYVPSMRNGRDVREDRGCAILSSLPLRDPTAIELPWVRQRRVALMATIAAADGDPAIQVVSAHLENRPGRQQQAAALADWLSQHTDPSLPLVVGADLNAWYGPGEDTVRAIDRIVPRVASCGDRPTFRFGLRLDYVFARANVSDCSVAASTYGSDHKPTVLLMRNW